MSFRHLVVLLGILFICDYISSVECITRTEVLRRAKFWADKPVAYSMSNYSPDPNGKLYRTDCSGYVSMAWALPTSLSTVTLPNQSYQIAKSQLKPGDAIMKGGPGTAGAAGHVVLFAGWTSSAQTHYWAYEQTSPYTTYRSIPYPYFNGGSGYVPYRYTGITEDLIPGCQCCKEQGLRNYCGHELCGLGCNANDIYACSSKGTEAYRYGPCTLGCIGSTTNSYCKV